MTSLAFHFLGYSGLAGIAGAGIWLAQAVGAICLFGVFLPVSVWASERRKERTEYYKAETLRRLAESPAESAKETIALLYAEERTRQTKIREGMKIGGVVCIAAGLGVAAFLYAVAGHDATVGVVGLIPALVGAALLVYVYLLAAPLE